ncbi:MAG: phospho-N-acetylmuramoyl-pentapeptide-transferase [Acidobacteriota bacterium]
MLYFLLVPLYKYFFFFNVFRYITVRTAIASLSALVMTLILVPWLINKLKKFHVGQQIREEGPPTHISKKDTPTMGGTIIIFSTIIQTLLWANLKNPYIWISLFSLVSFGMIGFWDDFMKIKRRNSKGISKRTKLILEIFMAFIIGLVLLILAKYGLFNLHLSFPFFKKWAPYLGWVYLPFIILIIAGSSNAVNLTDGLDGLATGTTLIAASAITALSYVSGHAVFATYLNIPKVPLGGELTIMVGSMVGASLGFLWYNCFPAKIFMGDVGALSMGALLGTVAILIKQELLLLFVGGLFIVEALSVIFQVLYFKISGGKRVFRMSPLHHHFEMIGWSEPQIVVRFWIVAIVFALFSLTTLKLR